MKKQQSNAGNTMLINDDGDRLLSPQIRSPFLRENSYVRLGGSGGMLEPGEDDLRKRALRELYEEQGVDIEDNVEEITGLLAATPNSTEMSKCFLVNYNKELDKGHYEIYEAGEYIGEKIPFPHNKIKEAKGIVLTTKYYDQVLLRKFKEKQIESQER